MNANDDYRWLFRKAPTYLTSIGEDGRYRDVSDALLARLGYDREDMIGQRPRDFVTPESGERIEREFLPTLRRTGRLENKQIDFLSRDGELVTCLVNSVVLHNPEGTFVRTVAVYAEISDLARADWKYRQLYRSTPAMLHTVTLHLL